MRELLSNEKTKVWKENEILIKASSKKKKKAQDEWEVILERKAIQGFSVSLLWNVNGILLFIPSYHLLSPPSHPSSLLLSFIENTYMNSGQVSQLIRASF